MEIFGEIQYTGQIFFVVLFQHHAFTKHIRKIRVWGNKNFKWRATKLKFQVRFDFAQLWKGKLKFYLCGSFKTHCTKCLVQYTQQLIEEWTRKKSLMPSGRIKSNFRENSSWKTGRITHFQNVSCKTDCINPHEQPFRES